MRGQGYLPLSGDPDQVVLIVNQSLFPIDHTYITGISSFYR